LEGARPRAPGGETAPLHVLLAGGASETVSEAFDLDAYLTRIGYTGPRTPTLATLRAIHALQPAKIPFESLDPFLRRPVRLDLASLQAKLVGERRGGYCFELNGLFAGALRALGFSITPLSGRVRWMAPPERPEGGRTHALTRVDLPDGAYLADVGFGGHLLAGPVRLEREIEQTTPAATVRLIGKDPHFVLQALLAVKGWQDLYLFTLEPALPIDYEIANWFTSTSPKSRFYPDFLAERLTPESRLSVLNAKVTKRHKDGETDQRILADAEEFAAVLEEELGITPPVDPAVIWERLLKG
jgi:N-hydroxyarylamine O-acetyltransferase